MGYSFRERQEEKEEDSDPGRKESHQGLHP